MDGFTRTEILILLMVAAMGVMVGAASVHERASATVVTSKTEAKDAGTKPDELPPMAPEAVADRLNECRRLGLEPYALYQNGNSYLTVVQCVPKTECK